MIYTTTVNVNKVITLFNSVEKETIFFDSTHTSFLYIILIVYTEGFVSCSANK